MTNASPPADSDQRVRVDKQPERLEDEMAGRGGVPYRSERMNEAEPERLAATPVVERVGTRLRQAREAQGLSLAQVGERTRVPLRHLEAIEATDFGALPSPTYAVGFARAYARALGLDDVATAQAVRAELGKIQRAPEYQPYETADPARVPPRGVTAVALGLAIAVLVLVGLWYGTDLFRGGSAPVTTAALPSAAPPAIATQPIAAPSPAAPRQVTLTAGDSDVWIRVYDAANTTLYQGTLKPGEKFDVPPTAEQPMVNVGRPDQLRITLDGRPVPALGDGSRAVKAPIDPTSMATRLEAAPATAPAAETTALSTGTVAGPQIAVAATQPPPSLRRPAPGDTEHVIPEFAANPPPPGPVRR